MSAGSAAAGQSLAQIYQPVPLTTPVAESWYALHTRSRHEKIVAERLEEQRITTYLPLMTETRQWSDRKKQVQLPLFSSYVFARLAPNRADRLRVLQVNGVVRLIGGRGEGAAIPDAQIEAVQSLLSHSLPWTNHPFLEIGQRVRIRSGALNGVEGILTARNGDRTLVISVDAIQRSLAVSVQGYEVEAV